MAANVVILRGRDKYCILSPDNQMVDKLRNIKIRNKNFTLSLHFKMN